MTETSTCLPELLYAPGCSGDVENIQFFPGDMPVAVLANILTEDIIIPQKAYPAQTTGFTANETVIFTRYGAPGVSLEAVLQPEFGMHEYKAENTGMSDGAHGSPLGTTSPKIILRLRWPGCQPFDKAIGIEETTKGQRRKVPKARLATKVAAVIKQFYREYKRDETWQDNAEWSPDHISFGTLVLLELRHVSKGSYQPVLAIRK